MRIVLTSLVRSCIEQSRATPNQDCEVRRPQCIRLERLGRRCRGQGAPRGVSRDKRANQREQGPFASASHGAIRLCGVTDADEAHRNVFGVRCSRQTTLRVVYAKRLLKMEIDPKTRNSKPTAKVVNQLLRTKFFDWKYEEEMRPLSNSSRHRGISESISIRAQAFASRDHPVHGRIARSKALDTRMTSSHR